MEGNVAPAVAVVFGAVLLFGIVAGMAVQKASLARQAHRKAREGIPGLRATAQGLSLQAVVRTLVMMAFAAAVAAVCVLGHFNSVSG